MHLDFIPDYSKMPKHELSTDEKVEDDKCNYERYRNVVINLAQGISEADALARIDVSETLPVLPIASKFHNEKKKLAKSRMAIAYDYGAGTSMMAQPSAAATHSDSDDDDNDKKAFSSEGEYEMDVDIDIMSTRQTDQLNVVSSDYGISSGKFCRALRNEKAVLLERKEIRMAELEKQAFSGKKARRERRMLKEFQLRGRANTPPSYTRRGSPSYEPYCREQWSGSSSRSTSPEDKEGEVQFITEFGSETKEVETSRKSRWDSRTRTGASLFSSRQRVRTGHQRRRSIPSPPQPSRSRRSRSRSRERYSSSHRFQSRSRSRSPSHDRFRRRRRSYSRSRSRSRERDNAELKMEQKLSKLKTNSGKTTKSTEKTGKTKLTPAERLKKKMQQQLSRTYKQEKRSEKEKAEAREAEKMEREEEMKEEMRKLKEREKQRWYKEHGNETPPRRRERSRSRSWSPPYYRY